MPTGPAPVVSVDLTSSTPPFEQVREQLRAQIGSGQLPPGTKLPPVRRLADEVGLATGTVARAYRELEELALIETRGRAGSRSPRSATRSSPRP